MSFLKNMLIGAIIGIANIIPGVSGGTMAVVLNVFDKIIDSVSHFTKKIKENVIFLVSILLGACVAIVLLSSGMTYLLDNYYMVTNLFFVGVILGSIPMITGKAVENRFKWYYLIPGLVTLGLMVLTMFISSGEAATKMTSLDLMSGLKLFFAGIISAFAMIIPGVSGSFVMVLLGMYETIIGAIKDFNILLVLVFGVGAAIGLLLGIKIIDKLIKKFPQATYFAILGLILGSLPVMFQKIAQQNAYVGGWQLAVGILVCVIGLVVSYLFSSEKFKNKITGNKNKEIKKSDI